MRSLQRWYYLVVVLVHQWQNEGDAPFRNAGDVVAGGVCGDCSRGPISGDVFRLFASQLSPSVALSAGEL